MIQSCCFRMRCFLFSKVILINKVILNEMKNLVKLRYLSTTLKMTGLFNKVILITKVILINKVILNEMKNLVLTISFDYAQDDRYVMIRLFDKVILINKVILNEMKNLVLTISLPTAGRLHVVQSDK